MIAHENNMAGKIHFESSDMKIITSIQALLIKLFDESFHIAGTVMTNLIIDNATVVISLSNRARKWPLRYLSDSEKTFIAGTFFPKHLLL